MTHEMPQDEVMAEAPVPQAGLTSWVEAQVRNTPWWLISIAFHLIVLAGMTVITFKEEVRISSTPDIIPLKAQTQRLNLPERPRDVFEPTNRGFSTADMVAKTTENDDPILPNFLEAEDSDHNENDVDKDTHTMFGDSKDFLGMNPGKTGGLGRGIGGPGTYDRMGVGDGGGSGGAHGDPFGGGSRNLRKVGLSGTPGASRASENAVKWGLWWLARHQGPSGAWSTAGFDHQCTGGKCDGPGYSEYDAGATGLSLLAFLGAGYTHLTKETYVDPVTKKTVCYGDVVRKAAKWLVENQDAEGCFGGRSGSKYMYNHAIAALAMAEAFGLTNAQVFKESSQRGIDFLCQAQNPYKAWRYTKRCDDNDTSVTGWAVMALKSGEMAGLAVPRSSFEGAKAWILEATDEAYYRTGYTAKGTGKVVVQGKNEDFDDHPALTAVGMLCRIFIDKNQKDPALDGGAKLMIADLPQYGGKKTDYYYWYYGSLALFQFDGPDGASFKAWNDAMTKALLPSQHEQRDGCSFGSWDSNVDRWGFEGGRVYATAINTLNLEVYYRYASAFGGKRGK
ncbi:MAG: hypothetical protein IT452_07055 [Planctomycetia bacterium]|nr:hypothetical protein [Planctomycetia bacterium]